jgi:hypothetical protein
VLREEVLREEDHPDSYLVSEVDICALINK